MSKNKISLGEKVSDAIAKFGGSWKFIFMAFGSIFIWISLNILTPLEWDKYPFILLNLLLSLIAAFQAPFIMMSQRRVEQKQDAAYRGLFAEIKNELHGINNILTELTDVMRNLSKMIQQQSENIESLEEELSDLNEEEKN